MEPILPVVMTVGVALLPSLAAVHVSLTLLCREECLAGLVCNCVWLQKATRVLIGACDVSHRRIPAGTNRNNRAHANTDLVLAGSSCVASAYTALGRMTLHQKARNNKQTTAY